MAYHCLRMAKCDEWKQTCKQTCQAKTLHARQERGGGVGERAARSKHESTQSGSILEPQYLQVCGGAWRVSCGCAVPLFGPNEVALGRSGEVRAFSGKTPDRSRLGRCRVSAFRASVRRFFRKNPNPGAKATPAGSLPGTFPSSCELCLRAARRSTAESVTGRRIFFSGTLLCETAPHRIAALSARISDCKHTLLCRGRAGTTHEPRSCSAGCVCTTATHKALLYCPASYLHATNAHTPSTLQPGPRPAPAVTSRPRALQSQCLPKQADWTC